MKTMIMLLVTAIILISAFPAYSQNFEFEKVKGFNPSVEQFKNGYIDWGNGFYYTVSRGYPPAQPRRRRIKMSLALQKVKAKQAAIEGAKAQILLMAKNIRVDADATIGDIIAAGYKIKVEGNIKKYTVVVEGWVEDPQKPYYEVVVKAPISNVSSQLIDSQLTKVRTGKRGEVKPQEAEEKKPEPKEEVEEKKEPEKEEPKEKTKKEKIEDIKEKAGDAEKEMLLLIDARGTDANQAMFPEVKSTDGADVFNITLPDNIKTKRQQMVKYVESDKKKEKLINELKKRRDILYITALPPKETIVFIEQYGAVLAADDGKPAAKPRRRRRFTCKATSSAGKLKANIIISKKDAERIAEADKKEKFFKNANVYVIMDSSIGGTESRIHEFLETILADI